MQTSCRRTVLGYLRAPVSDILGWVLRQNVSATVRNNGSSMHAKIMPDFPPACACEDKCATLLLKQDSMRFEIDG